MVDASSDTVRPRSMATLSSFIVSPIADGVFWSWYALRWEPNRGLRWAPITLFAATSAAIAAAYFARGRTIDYPRLMAVRYASGAAQHMLALCAMRSVAR